LAWPAPDLPPGLVRRRLAQGRHVLTLDLGTLGTVRVLAAPAPALTDPEWQCIGAARESYPRMWGIRPPVADGPSDPFDGRGEFAATYTTTHYIATVTTPGQPDKIITMRKVAINRATLLDDRADPPLVEDIAFWQVYDPVAGTTQPLGAVLHAYLERERGLGPYPSPAHLPIAALSRSGTLPYEHIPVRGQDERNRTAVAYALIQVAALAGDTDTVLYVAQICEEFRTRAFALHLPDGGRIELDYMPTTQALGLATDRAVVRLDRANPVVPGLLRAAPGFWLDNAGLARLLVDLVDSAVLYSAHFVPAAATLLESPDAARLTPDQQARLQQLVRQGALPLGDLREVAQLLARPRFAKFLIGLLQTQPELAARLLTDVADGPYSATLEPQTYWWSVLHLLHAAQELYT
jgi:hypothetical protein